MAELFANDFATTLAAPCTDVALTITVAGAAPAALQGGQFRVVIGSELLLVTAGQNTTTWTVTRGVEGTTAAAHAAGSSVAHVLTAAGLSRSSGHVSVIGYGAKGDGVTDDTAAIQAALADLPVSPAKMDLFFPSGTYLVSDTLDVPLPGWERIHGETWGATIIRMTASNKPILRFAHENTTGTEVSDLKLEFATPQPKTNTSAYGIQFYSNPGTGYGFYYLTFRRLWIAGAAVGIGIAGTGTIPVWGSSFESILISQTSLTALDFRSPTTAGMPNVLFRDIKIQNTGAGITDPSWAIRMEGVEAQFFGLGLEDWCNNGVEITGGGTPAFRGVHVERHAFTDAVSFLFYAANAPFIIEGATMLFCTSVPGVSIARLFSLSGASLVISGVVSRDWTITGGTVESLFGDTSSRIWATGCDWGSPGEYLVSGWGPGLYARVLVDGMPPTVDTLPAGAVQYRGRRFRVLGGAGVADVVSECSKNAADAYVWVTK